MLYRDIPLFSKKLSAKFWLCKPNRSVIYPLNEIFNKSLVTNVGEIHTFSFSFHSKVLRNNKFIENPLLEKLNGNYLVKMDMDGEISYFNINNLSKSFSGSDEVVNVTTSLEANKLSTVDIRGIEETAKSLRELVTIFLEETPWSVDFIDSDIEALRRSYELAKGTVLQAIMDVANKFNAIVQFNTLEKKISFKKYENIGINKGVKFKEGINLESFNLDIDHTTIVTTLKGYGSDGLEFRTLTPNGTNYIQDFTWFMYPFLCDDNYNVIKSSKYMSDELCIALVKYNKLLESVQGQFESLRLQKSNTQSQITSTNLVLNTLTNEMIILNAELDTINATYQESAPQRPDYIDVMNRRSIKQSEIDNTNNTLSSLISQIENIDNQLLQLQILISVNNNFTIDELHELTNFNRIEEYVNESIIDEQDLLDETKLALEGLKIPSLSLSMGIEAFANYFDVKLIDKLDLGDIVGLYSTTMKADVQGKIKGITYDFDNLNANITITNVKDVMNENEKFAYELNNALNNTNTVNFNKYKWKEGENANTLVNQILTSAYDTSKNVLLGGTENSITLTPRGLYNRDVQDSNTYMVINNGILAITPDNGNTVTVAIDKNGVHADKLVGRLILGNHLIIESDSGILETNGAVTNISDRNGNLKVTLGEYDNPTNTSQKKYGLRVYDGGIDIRTSADSDRGLQLDNNGIRTFNNNGVRTFDVNASSGMVSIVGSMSIKTSADTNRGVAIEGDGISAYNGSGTKTFYVDTNGNLTANTANITGIMNMTGGTISGDLVVTGSLNGGIITGALIQTSASYNNGLKMDSSGLSGYNNFGSRAFYLSNSGALTATDANITGIINATGGTISGNLTVNGTLTGGTINGASINTLQNATVGNNLYIGAQTSGTAKFIYFNSGAYISGGTGWIGSGIRLHGSDLNLDFTSIDFTSVVNNSGYVRSTTPNARIEISSFGLGVWIGNTMLGSIPFPTP